eukprot:scaffold96312_cov30-Tisochrysis_lutea.AAC.1
MKRRRQGAACLGGAGWASPKQPTGEGHSWHLRLQALAATEKQVRGLACLASRRSLALREAYPGRGTTSDSRVGNEKGRAQRGW